MSKRWDWYMWRMGKKGVLNPSLVVILSISLGFVFQEWGQTRGRALTLHTYTTTTHILPLKRMHWEFASQNRLRNKINWFIWMIKSDHAWILQITNYGCNNLYRQIMCKQQKRKIIHEKSWCSMELVTDQESLDNPVRVDIRYKWTHGWVENMILANPLPVQTPAAVWGNF